MRLAIFAFLSCLASVAHGAVKYIPANDSEPLLRRDLLPLDVDAIRDLAGHLAVLADGRMPKTASQLRLRAQMLTLSQRLLPAEARARSIEATFLKGESRPQPDNALLKPARNTVIKSAGWLSQLPKGEEGHHLGQLLLDLIHSMAPGHPVLQNRDVQNEAQRWSGVVAKVSSFEYSDKPVVNQHIPLKSGNRKKYATTALLTEVPMFSKGLADGSPPTPGLVTTSLVITKALPPDPDDKKAKAPEEGAPLGGMPFQPTPNFDVAPLYSALISFFSKNFEPLPEGYNLNVNTNKRQYLRKNRENIAANLAMMLDAAVSGRSLRQNTILFARLRADGSLQKPLFGWDLLRRIEELSLPQGTRLIVGQGMIEEMTALLVIDKASFFTQYEVFEAATFAEARDLFYDDGKLSDELKAASDGYIEVRNKAMEATNLATFLGLSAVEDRLKKASAHSPRHLSAMMLAKQSVRRPAYFTRYMFAQELNRLLEPLARFHYTIDQTPERAIKDAYKETRDRLTPLERRLERSETLILDDALNLIKRLNSVGRDASPLLDNAEIVRKRDLAEFKKKLEVFRADLRKIYEPAPVKDE